MVIDEWPQRFADIISLKVLKAPATDKLFHDGCKLSDGSVHILI
jgi:hypothetical protein